MMSVAEKVCHVCHTQQTLLGVSTRRHRDAAGWHWHPTRSPSPLSCYAHPREYSIGFTDHNLHISSSVRYLGTAQGMSINVESFDSESRIAYISKLWKNLDVFITEYK